MTGSFSAARRIAWLIIVVGIIAILIAAVITLANLADNFLTFSLTQIFWLGVLYVVVGVVLLLFSRAPEEPELIRQTAMGQAIDVRPAVRPVERNDLTMIEGIGPKSQQALNSAGIYNFQQLAEMDPADMLRIVRDEHNVQIVGEATVTWAKQALFIVHGDMEGLRRYQEHLRAGRDPEKN